MGGSMKLNKKTQAARFAAIVLTAALAIAFAGCGDGADSGSHTHTPGICTECGVLRITDAPVKFFHEPGPGYNFAQTYYDGDYHPLSEVISGTPIVAISGTGTSRKVTIELDEPGAGASAIALSKSFPGVTASGGANCYMLGFESLDASYDSYCLLPGKYDDWADDAFLLYADQDTYLTSTIVEFASMSVKKGWNYVFTTGFMNFTHAAQTLPAEYHWRVIWGL